MTKTKVGALVALAAAAVIGAIVYYKPGVFSKTDVVVSETRAPAREPLPAAHPTVNTRGLAGWHLDYGQNVIHRFTVVAPPGHDLSLGGFSFKVDLKLPAGFTVTHPYLTGANTSGTFTMDTSCGFPADPSHLCARVPFMSELVIPKGTAMDFMLLSNVNSPRGLTGLVTGNSISVTLLADYAANGALSGSGKSFGIGGKLQNMVWSDISASPHSLTSADWWSGFYATGLPLGPLTISRL